MDRSAVVRELETFFATQPAVAAAWLFGSVAKGRATDRSDIDVAVLLRRTPRTPKDLDAIAEIQDALQGLLHVDVDVAVLNRAAPDFVHRVLRDGVLVNDADHKARVLFEVQSRKDYWDVLPILQLYRRTVLRKS